MRNLLFFPVLIFLSTWSVLAQNSCENHPLFSILPQHRISSCEEKEFDTFKTDYTDKSGTWEKLEKSGYILKTYYTFEGAWEKRPSNPMIFQNYTQAVLSKGGSLISQSNSRTLLHLKSAGESWWIEVQSDQSGTFSVTCLKEESMNQYIVLTSEDIEREVKSTGKVAFYGIYFDTDRAEINPESKETLAQMAKYLKANPSIQVYIVGHTDNTGSMEHNQQLSEKRAEAVVQALILDYQISKNQLKSYGIASLSPVSTNATEEGKSKNRRVEMVLK